MAASERPRSRWHWLGYVVIGGLGVFAALGSHLTFNDGPGYSTDQVAATSAVVGQPAPGFSLTTAAGRTVSLSSWPHRPLVVAFLAPASTNSPPLKVLRMAVRLAGRDRAGWLVVNTDPTLTSVAALDRAVAHDPGGVQYATGSLLNLDAVWQSYGVDVSVVARQVVYSAAVYVLGPRHHIRDAFLVNLTDGRPATVRREAKRIARDLGRA
jgi:peroxiredoxin